MKVLFQNAHLIVVDKKCGTLSIEGREGRDDPRPILKDDLQKFLAQRVWTIHRLDAEVSGLIAFALNAEAHRLLNKCFEEHLIQKTYEAWTTPVHEGYKKGKLLNWESKLLRGKKRSYESPVGKEAKTEATWLGNETKTWSNCNQEVGKWTLNPITGRSHQLRYEMQKRKLPLLGDVLYGGSTPLSWPPETIGLRAVAIDFLKCPEAERAKFDIPAKVEAADLETYLRELK